MGVPAKDVPPGLFVTPDFGVGVAVEVWLLPNSEHPLTLIHKKRSSDVRKRFFACIFNVNLIS